MATHPLSAHFQYFFRRLNPSTSFQERAASEHKTITGLLEDRSGLASELAPVCFLQGSYKQDTAIYTINDLDIVALCRLWYPGSGDPTYKSWTRDTIFQAIAAPLLNDGRYKDKVRYNSQSMCIKVDLGIKVEILPVVYKSGNFDPAKEPFCLYRPEKGCWEDGYARDHQALLSEKNREARTNSNFIPAIKVFKHLRTSCDLDSVSFHIECFLHALPDALFRGSTPEYLERILSHIENTQYLLWWCREIKTPCGERKLFSPSEWNFDSWRKFHEAVVVWAKAARLANQCGDKEGAIECWRILLGEDFFPKAVSS